MSSERDLMLIGGVAAAAIVCEHDGEPYYSTPWDVWAAAHGAPEDRGPPPPLFTTGLALEPVLLDWWMREHGAGLTLTRAPVIRRGWQVGHLDGVAGPYVLDPKTSLQEFPWWLDEQEDIPAGYCVQGSWYARLVEESGVEVERVEFPIWCHARAARGLSPYMLRGFNWNDTARAEAARHLAIVEEWYGLHMAGGMPPAFDGGSSAARWLALQIGPVPARRERADPDPDLLLTVEEWRAAKREAALAKRKADAIGQGLMQSIGDRRLYAGARSFVQVQYQRGTPFLAAYGFDKSDNPEE